MTLEMFIMVCSALWALSDESHRQHITPIFSGPCNNKVHRHQISFKGTRGLQVQDCYIWDIYNLCALDVVICKKLQRNFNGLEAKRGRGKKNLWYGCLLPFLRVNHFYTKRKMKSFGYLRNSSIETVIIEKRRISSFYSDGLLIMCPASYKLHYMTYQHCPIQSRRKCYFH